jgi:hypothetical protein
MHMKTLSRREAFAITCNQPMQSTEQIGCGISNAVALWDNFFTVVFYGLKSFCCKSAQFCVMPCECLSTETPSICDDAQSGENTRKISFLN